MPNTEKTDVYSITGMFTEDHIPGEAKFFGGFLSVRTDSDQPRNSFFGQPFNGSLVDCYGRAQVLGTLTRNRLKFSKKYHSRSDLIEYAFEKNENGIWVGRYEIEKRKGTGHAFAKLKLDWKGIDMIIPRNIGPEEWSENLLERMIDRDMLKVVEEER